MSLMGRRTCVSASALSLDAQPAHAESVVRRISRPVWGIGIYKLQTTVTLKVTVVSVNELRRSGCIRQRQNELIAAWHKDGLHARGEFQNILILQQGGREGL